MAGSLALSPRRARMVRVMAVFFFLVALVSLAGAVAASVDPALNFRCNSAGCADRSQILRLAPDDARPALARSEEAQAAFVTYVNRLPVRLGLAGLSLVRGLPFAFLMAAVGFALRAFAARRGNDLASAMPWLRRGAVAALLMAVAAPIAESLQAMLLYPGTPLGAMWFVGVDFVQLSLNLLLAAAAISVVWALDAGARAEREAASFV